MPASSLDSFLWAIGQMESGGNYKARNPGGALGKYQVMPANVASWTKEALGHSLTPDQFYNSPSAQEAVARKILGGYYQKYGPAGAAAAWFSGSPNVNSNASDGNTTVRNYVKTVLSLMGKAPANAGNTGSTGDGVYRPGDTTTGGTATATQASYKDDAKCLVGMDIPLVGPVCLLTKGQGRAIEGGLLLLAGGIVASAGLIILASYGLKATGALQGVANAAAVVPGAGGLAAKAVSASGALKPKARPKARPNTNEVSADGGE
jgi:hypothetical protein